MTPFDPEEELTLERARLAPEPSVAAQARNLAALRARLGLPAPLATPAPVTTAPAAATFASAPLRQLVGVGIVTATLGFFVGLSVDRTALLEPSQSAAPLTAVATSTTAAPSGPAAREVGVTTQSASESDARASAPMAPLVMPNVPRSAHAPAAQRRNKNRADAARQGQMQTAGFLEAVQLLRRARNALQKGEAALALSLLDEMDERFPREVLDEERGATRVLSLCASGATEAARRLADGLSVRYPHSIYAPRLERSCVGSAAPRSEGRQRPATLRAE